jgi:predicted DNA-binding transcriptional regulator YafY
MGEELMVSIEDLSATMSFTNTKVPQVNLSHVQTLTEAIRKKQFVNMTYHRPTKKGEVYHIAPLHCANVNSTWYLFAYEKKAAKLNPNKAIRNFKMARIENVEIRDDKPHGGMAFKIEDHIDWGVMRGEQEIDVELEFDPSVQDYFAEKTFHKSQKVSYYPNGKLKVEFKLYHWLEFRAWVLGWGAAVKVRKPIELRESMRNIGVKIAKRHGYEFHDDDEIYEG